MVVVDPDDRDLPLAPGVAEYSFFCCCVTVHISVTVQMVWSKIQKDGDIESRVLNQVELIGRELEDDRVV